MLGAATYLFKPTSQSITVSTCMLTPARIRHQYSIKGVHYLAAHTLLVLALTALCGAGSALSHQGERRGPRLGPNFIEEVQAMDDKTREDFLTQQQGELVRIMDNLQR